MNGQGYDPNWAFQPGGKLPSQQGGGGGASEFTTPGGGTNWDLISMLLGQGAQAFSAQDPTSWQHQVGAMAGQYGQSKLYGKAATKARGEQNGQWEWLRNVLSGGVTPQGTTGTTFIKAGKAGEGKIPELTFGVTPSREVYEDIFGLGPLNTGGAPQGGAEPRPEPSPTQGGAGGQNVMAPFRRALQGESRQPIW